MTKLNHHGEPVQLQGQQKALRFGAPMGQPSAPCLDTSAGPLRLRRVPINSQGYARDGTYWGLGLPLWYAEDAHGAVYWFRAQSLTRATPHREAAKSALRGRFAGAAFYR